MYLLVNVHVVYNSRTTCIPVGLRSAYNRNMFASKHPTLVMLAGLPGTGKTTLAYALVQQLGWPVLDKDLINGVLLKAGMGQEQAAPLAYQLLFTFAEDLIIKQRLPIILDSAGRQLFILERAQNIAQRGNARFKVIYCVAPQHVRAQRLASRVAGPSQWAVDQATDEDGERWYAHLPLDKLVVHTAQPPENLATTA